MSDTNGLFFTSIPKAGKNLIYSFLSELGYKRAPIPRDPALWLVEKPWLEQVKRRCTYALPPMPAELATGLDEAFEVFIKAVTRLGGREVLHHHFPYGRALAERLHSAGVPVVFVTRDPRDLLLSMADYILVQKKPAHLAANYAELDRRSLIARLWSGDDELISLADYFAAFSGWRQAPGVITLHFEALIGEAGGGSQAEQARALKALVTGLGDVDDLVFQRACLKTFNRGAGTFYKGRRGRWREETDLEVLSLLQAPAMRSLAATWGYVD